MPKQKLASWITVVTFILLIFGISIINILVPDKAFSDSENRYLEQRPKFSLSALFDGSFIKKFETYTTDQFLWRDGFIGVKTTTEFSMGKKDTNGVFFGADGYLVQKHDDPEPIQVEKNIRFLTEFANRKAGQLDTVSVMIIPTASAVLTDKLPLLASDFDQLSMIEDIKSKLGSEVIFPSMEEALRSHAEEYIFYKTDHHWTSLGAYYGYRAWCDALGIEGQTLDDFTKETVTDSFYGTIYSKARLMNTKPDTIDRYIPKNPTSYTLDYNMGERTEDSLYDETALEKRDKYTYFLGGNHPIIKIEGQNKNGKKLAVIKDSFSHTFSPFIADDYQEVHMIDLRYVNVSLEQYLVDNGITDVLVLYNTINFATDNNVFKLTR